ncbi:hypothetical protein O181_030679 [Austropuccinia psidii MF-1]|uniref:Peptidase M13 N-terminal domain-containing protein n=1 Tax=Austropuccinia psidii MF-1 TaxID=1389203 RepID=A0A9Q3CTC8_9BASI|nr:hypothetical protein [Austropuccinia psidii MF-1]
MKLCTIALILLLPYFSRTFRYVNLDSSVADSSGFEIKAKSASGSFSKVSAQNDLKASAHSWCPKIIRKITEWLNRYLLELPIVQRRKARDQVRKNLSLNKDEISAMRSDYRIMMSTFSRLQKRKPELENYWVPYECKNVDMPWNDLKNLYQSLKVHTQRRLFDLAGLSSGLVAVEEPTKKASINSLFSVSGILPSLAIPTTPSQASTRSWRTLEVQDKRAFKLSPKPQGKRQVLLDGSVLKVINESIRDEMLEKLNDILHNFHFGPGYINVFLTTGQRLDIKTEFEKCVFHAIDFMYKYKICSQEDLRKFFSNGDTLEFTVLHIHDLFENNGNIFSLPHSLVPEWSFIINDRHTSHLHESLKGTSLDAATQAKLVNRLLSVVIKRYQETTFRQHPWNLMATQTYPLMRSALDILKKIFETTSTSSPKLVSMEDAQTDQITTFMKQIMAFFDSTPDFSNDKYSVGYLINYYILHFFNSYPYSPHVKIALAEFKKNRLFQEKFQLVENGLMVFQLANRLLDNDQYLTFRKERLDESQLPTQAIKELRLTMTRLADDYNSRRKAFFEREKSDEALDRWLNSHSQIVPFLTALAMRPDDFPKLKGKNTSLWFLPRGKFTNAYPNR